MTDKLSRLGLTWLDLQTAAAQAHDELGDDATTQELTERCTALLQARAGLQTPETSMTAADEADVALADVAKLEAEVTRAEKVCNIWQARSLGWQERAEKAEAEAVRLKRSFQLLNEGTAAAQIALVEKNNRLNAEVARLKADVKSFAARAFTAEKGLGEVLAREAALRAALDCEYLREMFGRIEDAGQYSEVGQLWPYVMDFMEVRRAALATDAGRAPEHVDEEYEGDHWATGRCPRCLAEIASGARDPKVGGRTLSENRQFAARALVDRVVEACAQLCGHQEDDHDCVPDCTGCADAASIRALNRDLVVGNSPRGETMTSEQARARALKEAVRDACALAAETSNFEDGPEGTIEGQIADQIRALDLSAVWTGDSPTDPAVKPVELWRVQCAKCGRYFDGPRDAPARCAACLEVKP